MIHPPPSALLASLALLGGLGCDGDGGPPADGGGRARILEVEAAEPLVEGSRLHVLGTGLETLGSGAALRVTPPAVALPSVDEEASGAKRVFEVTPQLVDRLGEGRHEVELRVERDGASSPDFAHAIVLARTLPVRLDEAPSGEVHRNELSIVRGAGLLAPGEGEVRARFRGEFVPRDDGAIVPVDVGLPVQLAEQLERDRGVVRLTTEIGGAAPGRFEGTARLRSKLRSGETSTSDLQETSLTFGPPELFDLSPTRVSLEQILTLRGAGFLGGERPPGEATLLQVDGTFTPEGGEPVPAGPGELVPQFISGTELRGVIAAETSGGALVSELFGAREGRFEGRVTPVVLSADAEVEGAPVPVALELTPVRQVVYLRFLPGFYDSLPRFGLAAAAGSVEPLVAERIESIYERWLIDVRLERPRDFSANGFTTVEIGGPDPNGLGLFGYDNTPGKDVGNLRLYDAIGGANAETQEDGYPGYGGVFVENFLHFSAHPELGGEPPRGAAPTDPLFDETFDPVRAEPARLAEVRGEGDAERVEQVHRALDALASVIGETTAHELGHSLGLADPFGPSDSYHHAGDQPGCLMDAGASRPFGERAALAGFEPTRLCGDAPRYLDELHGR